MKIIGLFILQICLILNIFVLTQEYGNFMGTLPTPVPTVKNPILENIKNNLLFLGAPKKVVEVQTKAIYAGYLTTGMLPELIISFVHTESRYDKNALGPKAWDGNRYGGLMGITNPSGYEDVDILKGIRKFHEKLIASKGNIPLAIAFYKGGNNNMARRQSAEVLRICAKLQQLNNGKQLAMLF